MRQFLTAMAISKEDSLCKKIFVTGWAFMECLLFGGLIYGWGSLNFVLKKEGIYAHLCKPIETLNASMEIASSLHASETTQDCKSQDRMMSLCFTIAVGFFCFGGAVLGHINYKFGTRVTRIIGIVLFVTGSLMMAFISKETPWLMFPGLILLGLGGLPLLVTNIQVSKLFVKGSSTVVGLLCGAFDLSSVVSLTVKIASDNGFSRQTVFIIIAALHGLVLISTFTFMPKEFITKQQIKHEQADIFKVEAAIHGQEHPQYEVTKDTDKADSMKVSVPSLKNCIRNPIFITHIIWISLLKLRYSYFIGTLNPFLNRALHGDIEKVSYFTNVCYYTMIGGIVICIIAGAVYDWQKSLFKDGQSERYRKIAPATVPQGIASLFAVILSILVLIPNPQTLYTAFIIMTIYRSFLFSLAAAFIGEVFPCEYFGMMNGLMIICGGTFSFLQYAIFTWSDSYIGGALHADLFLLAMVCLSFIHPIYILLSSLREESSHKITKSQYVTQNVKL